MKPRIEGYSARSSDIDAFAADFERDIGVTPEVGAREITDVQCPAVEFIGGLLNSRFPELTVRLDSDLIADESELRGTVLGVTLAWIHLVLIDDDGMAQDLTPYVEKTAAGISFVTPTYVQGQGRLRNQIIVAVASSQELESLKTASPIHAEEFLPRVVQEADETGTDVALGVGGVSSGAVNIYVS